MFPSAPAPTDAFLRRFHQHNGYDWKRREERGEPADKGVITRFRMKGLWLLRYARMLQHAELHGYEPIYLRRSAATPEAWPKGRTMRAHRVAGYYAQNPARLGADPKTLNGDGSLKGAHIRTLEETEHWAKCKGPGWKLLLSTANGRFIWSDELLLGDPAIMEAALVADDPGKWVCWPEPEHQTDKDAAIRAKLIQRAEAAQRAQATATAVAVRPMR